MFTRFIIYTSLIVSIGLFGGGNYLVSSQSSAANGAEEVDAPESESASWGAIKAMFRPCDSGDDDKRDKD